MKENKWLTSTARFLVGKGRMKYKRPYYNKLHPGKHLRNKKQ
jgi:hypothetical protein